MDRRGFLKGLVAVPIAGAAAKKILEEKFELEAGTASVEPYLDKEVIDKAEEVQHNYKCYKCYTTTSYISPIQHKPTYIAAFKASTHINTGDFVQVNADGMLTPCKFGDKYCIGYAVHDINDGVVHVALQGTYVNHS